MGETHQLPFRLHRTQAPEGEAAKAPALLDLAEDRLHGGLAFGINGPALLTGEPLPHGLGHRRFFHGSFRRHVTGDPGEMRVLEVGLAEETGYMYDESASQIFLFSWAVDALKRTTNLDDKEAIAEAIKTTKMTTLFGPLDFTTPVADQTSHPHVNCVVIPIAVAQWVKASGGKWPLKKVLVFSSNPDVFAVEAKVQPVQYS